MDDQLSLLRTKLTTHIGLLRSLAGSSWGAGARTLRIATLALIHSAAEYCTPVWSRSAHMNLRTEHIYFSRSLTNTIRK